ncbi:hypothetical protein K439DRAFT_1620547 [Ramaria rubella]|nr:hypothetical protein K439DRAFT_1620547 [Ramaria rubella]
MSRVHNCHLPTRLAHSHILIPLTMHLYVSQSSPTHHASAAIFVAHSFHFYPRSSPTLLHLSSLIVPLSRPLFHSPALYSLSLTHSSPPLGLYIPPHSPTLSPHSLPVLMPCAPPPPIPLLTAHLALPLDKTGPPRLLAHEELRNDPPHPKKHITKHGVMPYNKPTKPIKPVKAINKSSAPPNAPLNSDSSDVSEDKSELDTGNKIHKPGSGAGRPCCGGYNLETALGWHAKLYNKLKKSMHRRMVEHLDLMKSYSSQDPTLVTIVCNLTRVDFPDLEVFSDRPVTNLIKMHLKYTSCHARQTVQRLAAGQNVALQQDSDGNV